MSTGGFGFEKKNCALLILPIPIHCRASLGKPNGVMYACRTIRVNVFRGQRSHRATLGHTGY